MSCQFVLKLNEFNRIYQLIHGTIANEATAEKGCVFFAIVGSYLLNRYFDIPARPVAGGFVLRVSHEPHCIGYAKEVDGVWAWGDDAFHMWIETQDHIVDFMSPIYREAFGEAGPKLPVPRRMFQKRKDAEAPSPNDLNEPGNFFTFPDPEMSEELVGLFLRSPTNTDLLQAVETWFGKRRGKQRPTVRMGSNDGRIQELSLPVTVAVGSW